MDFAEADRLSATTDNQFILDLMPQHAIYVDLLPETARAVIGKCHEQGEGARKMLEWEGFAFSNVVDIFDGGPLLGAPRDSIRTLRESRLLRVNAGAGSKRALVASPNIADFRCVATRASVQDGAATVDAEALAAIGVAPGAQALVWADAD
jgi:arginine N-succinyltransferase